MPVASRPGFDVEFPGGKSTGSVDGCIHKFLRLNNFIHESALQTDCGFDGFADGNHLQGMAQSNETGQPLGSAGTRDQADLHLGLPEVNAFSCHPIMAHHGNFQAAPQTVAVDGRHHRFGTDLDAVNKFHAFL